MVFPSEPRFPTIWTDVVIADPVELVNVSTVRAKSSLPVLGTVTFRVTVSPATVPLAVMIVWPLSADAYVILLVLYGAPLTISRPKPSKALLVPWTISPEPKPLGVISKGKPWGELSVIGARP